MRVNPEAGGLAHRMGHVRGVDEHLGGDAPHVQAGAAEDPLLADGDALVGVTLVENRVPRTGSDDRNVELLHVRLLRVTRA